MAPAPFMEPIPCYGLKPHSGDKCRGNCRLHPLVVGPVAEMIALMADGLTWGDIAYYEEKAQKALPQKPQPAQKAMPAQPAQKAQPAQPAQQAQPQKPQPVKQSKPQKKKAQKKVRFVSPPVALEPFFQSATLFWELPQDGELVLTGANFWPAKEPTYVM
jgi:uncharacterized iron-regulated membrane protein